MSVSAMFRQLSGSQAAVAGAVAGLLAVTFAASTLIGASKPALLPALDEDEALDLMEKMFKQIRLAANNMVNAHANIKQQIVQQGQQMSDRDIMTSFILPHFETSLAEIQAQVLADADVEECEIDEAVSYYEQRCPEIGEIVFKIKTVYREMGGEVDLDYAQLPPGEERPGVDLSLEQLLAFLHVVSEKMTLGIGEYADAFISEHGIPHSAATKQSFQMGMMAVSDEAQKTSLAEFRITESDLQTALRENQTSEELQTVFFRMQIESQRILVGKGIALEG